MVLQPEAKRAQASASTRVTMFFWDDFMVANCSIAFDTNGPRGWLAI